MTQADQAKADPHHATQTEDKSLPANEPLGLIDLDRFSLIAFYLEIYVTYVQEQNGSGTRLGCPGPGGSWENLTVLPASKDAESPS